MINPLYEKLAKLVVEYSLKIKKDQRVMIKGPIIAKDLIQAIYIEIIKEGAHPWLNVEVEGIKEIFLKHTSEEQLLYVDNLEKQAVKEFDRFISIHADYNTRKFSMISPKTIAMYGGAPDRKELNNIFEDRFFKGELKWVIIPFPCNSLA